MYWAISLSPYPEIRLYFSFTSKIGPDFRVLEPPSSAIEGIWLLPFQWFNFLSPHRKTPFYSWNNIYISNFFSFTIIILHSIGQFSRHLKKPCWRWWSTHPLRVFQKIVNVPSYFFFYYSLQHKEYINIFLFQINKSEVSFHSPMQISMFGLIGVHITMWTVCKTWRKLRKNRTIEDFFWTKLEIKNVLS